MEKEEEIKFGMPGYVTDFCYYCGEKAPEKVPLFGFYTEGIDDGPLYVCHECAYIKMPASLSERLGVNTVQAQSAWKLWMFLQGEFKPPEFWNMVRDEQAKD